MCLIGGHRSGTISTDELMVAVRNMAALNAPAAVAMRACGCRGATDITGYGLGGHAWELAAASGVRLVFPVVSSLGFSER